MSTRINTEDFIEALFAKNKALFGDARMELVPDEPEATEETPSEEPPAEGEPVEETPEEESTEEPNPDPAWMEKELAKARKEAANYRTRLRDAETKLSEAKTPEEVEAALSEMRAQNAKLEREILVNKVAAKHELPAALADRLKGDSLEELEADAKVLASVAATAAPANLEGGLTPDEDDDTEMDPRKLASRFRRT